MDQMLKSILAIIFGFIGGFVLSVIMVDLSFHLFGHVASIGILTLILPFVGAGSALWLIKKKRAALALLALIGGYMGGVVLLKVYGMVGHMIFNQPVWFSALKYVPFITAVASAIIVMLLPTCTHQGKQ